MGWVYGEGGTCCYHAGIPVPDRWVEYPGRGEDRYLYRFIDL